MRRLLGVGLAALLAGCASAPPKVADPEAAWQERRDRFAGLTNWTATGKVAIRTEEEAWSATLHWVQDQAEYRIRLIAPLGQGTLQIAGDDSRVELRTSEDKIYHAVDPESLLSDTLGWSVPVKGLRFWMTGLDDPYGPPPEHRLDVSGRLQHLSQSGWSIDYQRYEDDAPLALPTKLKLHNKGLAMRVVVNRWELERP